MVVDERSELRLAELVAKVLAGEEVLLARDGVPVTRMVGVEPRQHVEPEVAARRFGALKGQIWMADDFDEFTPEMAAMFDGSIGGVRAPDL